MHAAATQLPMVVPKTIANMKGSHPSTYPRPQALLPAFNVASF